MILHLKRYSYGEFETEGRLIVGDKIFATIEQPWTANPNGSKGGKPNESCIPDGMYRLAPYTRPSNNAECWIIYNPQELGVYRFPQDHLVDSGRNLCLIHKGNWASDVQGCIIPGLKRWPMPSGLNADPKLNEQAVKSSGKAMNELRKLLGNGQHILSITSDTGAKG